VLRVLHVITELNLGGAEVMLQRLLAAFERSGFEHHVVSLMDLGIVSERIRQLGVPTEALHMTRFPNPLKLVELARRIRALRADVVQTWMYHADLIGGLAARAAGRPVIWGLHNSTLHPQSTRATTRAIAAACARLSHVLPSRIVSVSQGARELHVQMGYAEEKFLFLPNGFDTREYRPDAARRREAREELGLSDEAVVIGMVARVDPQKDHENFLRAAAILAQRRPEVRFLLCGLGATRENRALAGLVEGLGLEDRVLLLGRRTDVDRIMNAIDVGTLSSAYGEAFPLVIGEAMASGVPCVVPDLGDCGYLVADTGRVVPPRDPAALARAWQELVDMGAEGRRRLGVAARARIESHFAIADIAARYATLYREVAGASRRPWLSRRRP
jgi:glycosyltransferase involved in cell wall biosynthesis